MFNRIEMKNEDELREGVNDCRWWLWWGAR